MHDDTALTDHERIAQLEAEVAALSVIVAKLIRVIDANTEYVGYELVEKAGAYLEALERARRA